MAYKVLKNGLGLWDSCTFYEAININRTCYSLGTRKASPGVDLNGLCSSKGILF